MDKLVLWAIADAHNREKECSYPSIAAVVEFTGWQRRAVVSSLTRLAAAGLIVDTRDRIGRTRQIKVWRFPFDRQGVQETHPSPCRKSASASTLSDD
jgi:pyocin large subunit-like protein